MLELTMRNLRKRGYHPIYFETKEEAADYLNEQIDGKKVAMGGSVTSQELGIYESLGKHNEVYWHWRQDPALQRQKESECDVYICGINAISQTGEFVNIDGKGNRVTTSAYGDCKVYFVAGINKLTHDLESAIFRAKNVAAPKNAKRFHLKTPCATAEEERCYDCQVEQRICRLMMVYTWASSIKKDTEVILIGEELGY